MSLWKMNERMVRKENVFPTVECQQMNMEGMMVLEISLFCNHHSNN